MDFLSWNDTVKLAFLIVMTGLTIGLMLFLMFTLWLGVKRQATRTSEQLIHEAAEKKRAEEKEKNEQD